MNSVEKVHAMAQEYAGPPSPDDGPQELMLRSATQVVGPMFLPMIPEDPQVLDQALAEMAAKLLELRSDGAPPVEIAVDGQPLELAAGEPAEELD